MFNKKISNKKGLIGESIAENYLIKQGYKILYRRYKSIFGEVDIVALLEDAIVFVEVKNRNSSISIDEAITTAQIKRNIQAAKYFMSKHPEFYDFPARFDLIFMINEQVIEHVKDAWQT